jgi:hypothetical protein
MVDPLLSAVFFSLIRRWVSVKRVKGDQNYIKAVSLEFL